MSEHKHDHDCDCGCNEEVTVTLTLDNDEEIECAVLTIYEVDGKEYIALLPLDEEGDNEEGEVYIYRYVETADGEPTLENIEDDDGNLVELIWKVGDLESNESALLHIMQVFWTACGIRWSTPV